MALFRKLEKPRGFNYRPRFYDPDKEAREARKKVVLGEKYRSPEELAREEAGLEQQYTPGAFLRDHVASRRGSHAADVMRRRRRKIVSVPILIAVSAAIVLIVWLLYFKR